MKINSQKAYLIGSGIASLASAAYLIRDGGFDGENIHIFEEKEYIGGSLDGKDISKIDISQEARGCLQKKFIIAPKIFFLSYPSIKIPKDPP